MKLPEDLRRAFHGARIGARLSLGPGRLAELRRLTLRAAAVAVVVAIAGHEIFRG
ncbi:MAG: hypothetical protein M1449_02415 [Candidatus Thermoplasmatota archaeon]|nr:hypothetical protein [Candidatus Thermoplasmatota archaeon]